MNKEKDKKIRAFLALDPPAHIRESLDAAKKEIQKELTGSLRWVRTDSVHLTLKFFGNISLEDVEHISQAVGGETGRLSPLRLTIKSIGVFPHLQRPRVIWLGTGGELERLVHLAQSVNLALELVGFPKEDRPFIPHWTLARINDRLDTSKLKRLIEAYGEKTWGEFTGEALTLFQSELTPKGAIYTPLRKFQFGVMEIK